MVQFDKITARLRNLCKNDLNQKYVNIFELAKTVINGLYDGVQTSQLDNLAAETAATMALEHPDYTRLASRIAVSNLHKQTDKKFSAVIEKLYRSRETHADNKQISTECYLFIMKHATELDAEMKYNLDYDYNYFGFKTLEHSYLMRIEGVVVERPQHMLMRVAVGIHKNCLSDILLTYQLLAHKMYIHATPTLFAAGTDCPQMSSCFLLPIKNDSVLGIYSTILDCAMIAKNAGGIGLSVHNVRGRGSIIKSTGGKAGGLIPMLRVFNSSSKYIDQGGRRPGSCAVYIEPWHCDIMQFLKLKLNNGKEEDRARDLFYGLWIPDLFMHRVFKNETWSLMCPSECPGLNECYGDEFDKLYTMYETEKRYKQQIDARTLWKLIITAQIETGTPYMLYKDACNMKSNQKNLGTIQSSNLCTEIIQYTAADEIAVCNLASISLPSFVNIDERTGVSTFDFIKLKEVAGIVCYNLNKIIDNNKYPVAAARTSNLKHRPIGIGVQGLANTFMKMRLSYDSEHARELNKRIFETIYYGALDTSCTLASIHQPYQSYANSPMSQGKLQFHMWDNIDKQDNKLWNWTELIEKIEKYGVRNSLLTTLMPTASTAQILDNYESFEPCNSNLYSRKVVSGEFQLINNYLINDLIDANLWDEDMRLLLVGMRGSIQNIEAIPLELRELYKTVWEVCSFFSLKIYLNLSYLFFLFF